MELHVDAYDAMGFVQWTVAYRAAGGSFAPLCQGTFETADAPTAQDEAAYWVWEIARAVDDHFSGARGR